MGRPTAKPRLSEPESGLSIQLHGSITAGEQRNLVAQELASSHEVWLVDRRGRGLSGDADAYSLAAEAADVSAVLGQAGPEAVMVAHSWMSSGTARASFTRMRAGTAEEYALIFAREAAYNPSWLILYATYAGLRGRGLI